MAVPGISEAALAELMSAVEKGYKALRLERHARAADLFGRAAACVAAAGAPPDSLILAALLMRRASSLMQQQQQFCSISFSPDAPALSADASAITCDVRRTLCARDKAGTLLPGGLRSDELAFARALIPVELGFTDPVLYSDEHIRRFAVADAVLLGYDTALRCATLSLSRLMPKSDDMNTIMLPSLAGAEADADRAWVLRAMSLVCEVQHTFHTFSGPEMSFLYMLNFIVKQIEVGGLAVVDARFRDALSAAFFAPQFVTSLQAHGSFQKLSSGWMVKDVAESKARHEADVAAFGLRACALPSCSAREVTVRQFKVCGACKQAAYCCFEHSKAHWKAGHKQECSGAAKK